MSRRFRQRPLKEYSEEFNSESYEKGGSLAIKAQIKDLERLIVRMKENATQGVTELSGTLKDDYNKLRNLVALLYNTEAYQLLWDLIVKHFTSLKVTPGTLGAYCGGCLTVSEGTGEVGEGCNACSATCAGSIPPKLPEWSICDNSVIIGVPNGPNHSFSLTHQSNPDHHHYVFIYRSEVNNKEAVLTPEQLFSRTDLKRLTALGAKKVHVYAYDEGNRYFDLTKGPQELQAVERSSNNSRSNWSSRFGSQQNNVHLLGGVVFFIVIIIIITLLMRRRRLG